MVVNSYAFGAAAPAYGLALGALGLFAAGTDAAGTANYDLCERITIDTPGNATDVANLTVSRYGVGAVSNGAGGRAVYAGGRSGGGTHYNVVDYKAISTGADCADFGDLQSAAAYNAGCANDTYGFFINGFNGTASIRIINRITTATPGNASDHGDTLGDNNGGAATADETVGVYQQGGSTNLETFSLDTPGNSTDSGGDLGGSNPVGTVAITDGTTAVWHRGFESSAVRKTLYYTAIPPASGTASTWGDLTVARYACAGASDGTYGVVCAGWGGTEQNVIDYINFGSVGNAVDFGDSTLARHWTAGCAGD